MVVVACGKRSQCLADRCRRRAGFFGEAQERRFVRQDELQHAGQESWFARGFPYRVRLYAGNGQEARQKFGIGGNEAERVDGDCLCLLAH